MKTTQYISICIMVYQQLRPNMKSILKVLFVLNFLFFLPMTHTGTLLAQNVGINGTGAAPDASAMLDVASTTSGLLIPRVALAATTSTVPMSVTPTTSMLVYNTATAGTSPDNVTPGFYYWNGTIWVSLTSSSSSIRDSHCYTCDGF